MTSERWTKETDVVVVGTGGAALTAAIVAHQEGAEVMVLERTDKVGGTTAVSGGGLWIPLNHHMAAAGFADSRAEALVYCRRLTAGRAADELIETFVDTGHVMVRYMEEHSPLRLSIWPTPDDYYGLEGGKPGGRTLEPQLFSTDELGDWAGALRPAPMFTLPLTLHEMEGLLIGRGKTVVEDLDARARKHLVGCGPALIGWLLKGCLDRRIDIRLNTRARQLLRDGERIIGVRGEQQGQPVLVRARRGVVLACGGFEWNEALCKHFLRGPITHPTSPPGNEGDGLIMAMEVGADLANMDEAWWIPAATAADEMYDGHPLSRFTATERSGPHTIVVNRFGQRFTNEGGPHKSMGYAMHHFDPSVQVYDFRNLPCWAIFDAQHRRRFPVLTVMPQAPDPAWLPHADTLEVLARQVGIDPTGLARTVERWNAFARQGHDEDFLRGESATERYGTDPNAPPNLGAIEQPPFYALPIYAGVLGTAGGPRTNTRGQVLNVHGTAIPGLYAAGNTAASPTGAGYYGNGGTIGPGMTWGYLCGRNAARG